MQGKGPRNGDEDGEEEEEEGGRRSPRSTRPSGKGEKRISASDDDSDIMPRVIRKKKARKLNDLSATEDEDDSDEEFKATSEDLRYFPIMPQSFLKRIDEMYHSESEEDDEGASESGDSFVVDDESDDDDVVYVRGGKKGRAASPVARRATRGARKRYAKSKQIEFLDSRFTSMTGSCFSGQRQRVERGGERVRGGQQTEARQRFVGRVFRRFQQRRLLGTLEKATVTFPVVSYSN